MRVSLSADIKKATRKLDRAAKKQIPFAASKTLNQLAYNISRKSLPTKADKVFEGGATSFTKRGFKYAKSSKRRLTSVVYIDDKQSEYMRYSIKGGTRQPDKVAILAPTKNSKLNKFGNFTKSTINKMLNDKVRYFKGTPKGRTPTADNQGIYQRYGGKLKGGGKKIKQVARYKPEQRYGAKFLFERYITNEVASRRKGFMPRFKNNLQDALRTAR